MPEINNQGFIPVDQKMLTYAKETIEALRKNFKTQAIFPYEVYPGYLEKNRKIFGKSWKSTGAAFDSFYFQVRDASPSSVHLEFFYNYYLNFVDLGVGAGRKAGDVQRSNPANVDLRYISNWVPKEGRTHRPAISMEFRHLAGRIQRYFATRYSVQAQVLVVNALGVDSV